MTPSVQLSIVVPTFNEAGNIGMLVEKLGSALGPLPWEVIFVDDDSPDGTASEVRRLAQTDGRVRVLQRIDRRGLGYRFDLDADVPWSRIDEPGAFFGPRLLARLGVDAAALAADAEAADLLQWGLALATCEAFAGLERAYAMRFATRSPSRRWQLRSRHTPTRTGEGGVRRKCG